MGDNSLSLRDQIQRRGQTVRRRLFPVDRLRERPVIPARGTRPGTVHPDAGKSGSVDATRAQPAEIGVSHPVISCVAYEASHGKDTSDMVPLDKEEDKATPIPSYEPDDPEILSRLFGVRW